MKLKALYKIH